MSPPASTDARAAAATTTTAPWPTAAAAAGYEVRSPHQPSGGILPSLIIECDRTPVDSRTGAGTAADRGAARLVLCAEGSLSALDPGGSAVGFHVLPPF